MASVLWPDCPVPPFARTQEGNAFDDDYSPTLAYYDNDEACAYPPARQRLLSVVLAPWRAPSALRSAPGASCACTVPRS